MEQFFEILEYFNQGRKVQIMETSFFVILQKLLDSIITIIHSLSPTFNFPLVISFHHLSLVNFIAIYLA